MRRNVVHFTTGCLLAALAGFFQSAHAAPPSPQGFKVAGIGLGMTVAEATDAVKQRDPGLVTRPILGPPRDGKPQVVGFVAEHSGAHSDSEAVIVLVTRNGGRVYEILHEQIYPPGHEVTVANLKTAVADSYGLKLVDIVNMHSINIDFMPDGTKDPSGSCAIGSNISDQLLPSADPLLREPLLYQMRIWTNPVRGCGVSLYVIGSGGQSNLGIVDTVVQQLFDQAADVADIEMTQAQEKARTDKANSAAVQARAANGAGL